MYWNGNVLITILAAILYGVIFTLVLISKPLNRLKKIFGFYLLAMFIWSVSAFLTISGFGNVLIWFKMMSASPIMSAVSLFFFIQNLFGFRRKWAPFTIVYGILGILITLFTNISVQSASLSQTGALNYELGSFFPLVVLPAYSLVLVCLFDLIQGFRRTQDAQHRERIRYLVIGISITIFATLPNFTPLGKYPIDIAGNGVTALLIAYAILRHKLLDIQVVVRLGLLYSITSAFFSAIYFLVISLVLNTFALLTGRTVFIASILVGILSAIVLSPLRNLAQTWIDRIFYRDKYNADLMLERLSQKATSLLDIQKITRMILSEVNITMHIERGAILIKDVESGGFQVIAEGGENIFFSKGFRADHPIITLLSRRNLPLLKRDLSFEPIFKSIWKEEKEELEKYNAEIFLPLKSKGDLIGILILSNKLSSQPFTQAEQMILSTLANQTAVAIENARLYDELRESFVQSVTALANAIDIRDTYTKAHSQEIADLAAKTARALGCTTNEVDEIYLGGLLHDIGKIGVPDAILQKPTKLGEDEWKVVKKHPSLGAELISPIRRLAGVSPLIENSHERFDGLGYPHGIKGEDIPLGARIISVVDSYSAMLDERPYKKPFTSENIVKELKDNSGKMYDPRVVEVFLEIIQKEGGGKTE